MNRFVQLVRIGIVTTGLLLASVASAGETTRSKRLQKLSTSLQDKFKSARTAAQTNPQNSDEYKAYVASLQSLEDRAKELGAKADSDLFAYDGADTDLKKQLEEIANKYLDKLDDINNTAIDAANLNLTNPQLTEALAAMRSDALSEVLSKAVTDKFGPPLTDDQKKQILATLKACN